MTRIVSKFGIAAALTLGMLSTAAAQGTTKVTGAINQSNPDGTGVHGTFTCTGTPTCTGTYNLNIHDSDCSNTFVVADVIVITGLDLSHPGSVQGSVVRVPGWLTWPWRVLRLGAGSYYPSGGGRRTDSRIRLP
jgi:hypothetical protein